MPSPAQSEMKKGIEMRAFQIAEYESEPSFVDIFPSPPGAQEISVQIKAAALNFADLLMIKGRYQERPDPPVTLGMELAGVISDIGQDVTNSANPPCPA